MPAKKEQLNKKYKPESNLKAIPLSADWRDIEGIDKPENNATRNQIFAQNAAPTKDYKEGDLWFDTDDDNKIYRANSDLSWVSVQDGSIFGGEWADILDGAGTKPDDNATEGATFGSNITGGGTGNTQTGNDGYTTLLRQTIFGNGSDGAVVSGGDITLTADAHYTNITIETGDVLYTAGYKVFFTGTLTCEGTGKIVNTGSKGANGNAGTSPGTGRAAGGPGGAATGAGSLPASEAGVTGGLGGNNANVNGDAGAAGTAAAKALAGAGVAGGDGGTGTTGTGGAIGAAGAATGTIYNYPQSIVNANTLTDTNPTITALNLNAGSGSGGGGGYNNPGGGGGAGGGSGSGGGIVFLSGKTIAADLEIDVSGGDGGNGGAAYHANAGAGGGGGGGRGGVAILIYETIGTYTITKSGGSAGAQGSVGNVGGTAATAGGDGVQYLINI